MVASQPPGKRLRRLEKYRNACSHCRKIDGREFVVVDPAKPFKDGNTEVWPGKTNIGRSMSPRKRVGGVLIDREPDELWWVAAGVQHPNCRGTWLPLEDSRPEDDAEFAEWLRRALEDDGLS